MTTLLIDSHLDIAMNAFYYNRDLNQSIAEIRATEADDPRKGFGCNTVSLPELRRGGIGLSFVTVLARANPKGKAEIDFRTQQIACAHAEGQLAYYHELERAGAIRMIADRRTLDAHLAEWEANPETTPLGFVLTMEGADPITSPDQVHRWWDMGLRTLSLAHYGPSAYAHGTASVGGLTDMGRALIDEMSGTGMALDITHLCDDSFWEATGRFKGPLLATHSNCRALVPGDRQLTDDMIRVMIEREAVIGVVLDAWMLSPGWVIGKTTPQSAGVTLEDLVNHIDHICQIAGNARHAAIGTDLDGGYGTEQTPQDLDTIADLQRLPEMLKARGYSPADIALVMHGNWTRWLHQTWG